MYSGLICLKNIIQSFEFDIDSDRKPLYQIVELFYPTLEKIIENIQSISQNFQIKFMHLITKIFFISNQVQFTIFDNFEFQI